MERDIHRETAARIFEVPENEVTEEQRRAAKTQNFMEMYGTVGGPGKLKAFSLAEEAIMAHQISILKDFLKWLKEKDISLCYDTGSEEGYVVVPFSDEEVVEDFLTSGQKTEG